MKQIEGITIKEFKWKGYTNSDAKYNYNLPNQIGLEFWELLYQSDIGSFVSDQAEAWKPPFL